MTQTNVDVREYHDAPLWPGRLGIIRWVRPAIIGALLLGVFWPTMCVVAARWSGDANWSHGWLVPLFSLYFLYTRRGQLARTETKTCYAGLAILLLALAAFFFFLGVKPFNYFQVLALVGAIFGLTLFLAGWGVMRIAWLPILFLCLANPIPDRYYVELTMPLRMLTTQIAQLPLSLIPGIDLEAQGVIIDYTRDGFRGKLNVEEACAGMRLMMAFVTLGVAMAYLGDRPTWQRICMVLVCIPIAVFCNLIRVTVTGVLTIYGSDWARGTPHALLGLAMLPIALGLFALTGYILKHLFVEDEPAEA